MNQPASVCSSSGLTRYHSQPSSSSVFTSLTDLCDDHGCHMSADANLRAQLLLSSYFLDDFHRRQQQQHQRRRQQQQQQHRWQQQQNGLPALTPNLQMLQQDHHQQEQQQNGLPLLEPATQMLQPYPVAAQSHLRLGRSVCEGSQSAAHPLAGDLDPSSDGFGCATSNRSSQLVATAAHPSSAFPATPKSHLLRHSSSPATLLRHNRQKLRQKTASCFSSECNSQELFLREESSDEDAGFAQNPRPKKRFCDKILHQIRHLQHGRRNHEGEGAKNAAMPQQFLLLPCNTTPCLAPAKRGFAIHPRSISERLRRTRISEGIKKLQELVPTIAKQMNTSQMLDEAVQYIKSLQRQVQELSENQITLSDAP